MSSEVHRYKVGDIGVTVLADGFRMASPDGYILNASKDELLATLSDAGLPTDHMKNVYAPVLIETGGKRVLIDTGNGETAFAQSKGERGRLQHNLAAAGLDRNTIDVVVISHFHARPREWPARCRQHHRGVSERRDHGAGTGMGVLDG